MSENKIEICVIDYRTGNIGSVSNILSKLNINYLVSNKNEDLERSSHLILPGVGSFEVAMKNLIKYVDIKFLENEVLVKKKPILGICVGMQLMADVGREFGEHKGLGWINGEVEIINSKQNTLPHIGWNSVNFEKESSLFDNIENGEDFYFVNSYFLNLKNHNNLLSSTFYGSKFASSVNDNNIYGVQFHPEKSQKNGEKLILNFCKKI